MLEVPGHQHILPSQDGGRDVQSIAVRYRAESPRLDVPGRELPHLVRDRVHGDAIEQPSKVRPPCRVWRLLQFIPSQL
ncbi:MAG: hypothetical protein ABSB82_04960 [Terriglobia bacterium]